MRSTNWPIGWGERSKSREVEDCAWPGSYLMTSFSVPWLL